MPIQAQEAPEVDFNHEAGLKYTVLMTDPDAPSPLSPVFADYLHWLVINAPGARETSRRGGRGGAHQAAYLHGL